MKRRLLTLDPLLLWQEHYIVPTLATNDATNDGRIVGSPLHACIVGGQSSVASVGMMYYSCRRSGSSVAGAVSSPLLLSRYGRRPATMLLKCAFLLNSVLT
jgi:hypothetical protein